MLRRQNTDEIASYICNIRVLCTYAAAIMGNNYRAVLSSQTFMHTLCKKKKQKRGIGLGPMRVFFATAITNTWPLTISKNQHSTRLSRSHLFGDEGRRVIFSFSCPKSRTTFKPCFLRLPSREKNEPAKDGNGWGTTAKLREKGGYLSSSS